MDTSIKKQIKRETVFICVLDDKFYESDSEEWLSYALKLKKSILVWRPSSTHDAVLPKGLDSYDDYALVDGGTAEMIDGFSRYRKMVLKRGKGRSK